jgi:hypothetical protein
MISVKTRCEFFFCYKEYLTLWAAKTPEEISHAKGVLKDRKHLFDVMYENKTATLSWDLI